MHRTTGTVLRGYCGPVLAVGSMDLRVCSLKRHAVTLQIPVHHCILTRLPANLNHAEERFGVAAGGQDRPSRNRHGDLLAAWPMHDGPNRSYYAIQHPKAFSSGKVVPWKRQA